MLCRCVSRTPGPSAVSRNVHRVLAGVASGALNWSEVEQLLSRLRVLVDQGLDLTPQSG
jgi:hypothetical protein